MVAGNTAAGEGEDCELLPALLRLAAHDSPIIRAHAVWAVHQVVGAKAAGRLLADIRSDESDETVLAEYEGPT